jgi:acyl-CoA thioesterase FadM
MEQIIEKDGILTSEAEIVLVTVNKSGKPVKIPDILEKKLN